MAALCCTLPHTQFWDVESGPTEWTHCHPLCVFLPVTDVSGKWHPLLDGWESCEQWEWQRRWRECVGPARGDGMCVSLTNGAAGITPTLLDSWAAFLTTFLLLLPVLPIQFLVITLTCTVACSVPLTSLDLSFINYKMKVHYVISQVCSSKWSVCYFVVILSEYLTEKND